jgi:hypothetical protein
MTSPVGGGHGVQSPNLSPDGEQQIQKSADYQFGPEYSGRLIGDQHQEGYDDDRCERVKRLTRLASAIWVTPDRRPVNCERDEQQPDQHSSG